MTITNSILLYIHVCGLILRKLQDQYIVAYFILWIMVLLVPRNLRSFFSFSFSAFGNVMLEPIRTSKLGSMDLIRSSANQYTIIYVRSICDNRRHELLSIVYRSYGSQTNLIKLNLNFFYAVVVSILLYGCTPWTLTKRIEKKLDGNGTRMQRVILNKSRKQHSKKQQPYLLTSHL